METTEKTSSTSKESTESVDKLSGKTVMYVIYLLYKANLITRDHLSHLFKIVKQPEPEDVTKYLVGEEAKK